MPADGDRAIANLLSALAESPDPPAATSRLLARLTEIAGVARACLLRLDERGETLVAGGAVGFDDGPPALAIPMSDVSSALVSSTLALAPTRGYGPLGPPAFASLQQWVAIPMSRPPAPGADGEHVRESVPAGVVVLEGPISDNALDDVREVVTLAGPIIARLVSLGQFRERAAELDRQMARVCLAERTARGERDRLQLVLDNVADPILVTDQRSNIILMNDHAERLFETGDKCGLGSRETEAVRGNDEKFTTFISEFARLGDDSRRGRMSLTQPMDGFAQPVEVLSGKVKNQRGEPIAVVSVLHDLTEQVENERLLADQNERLRWQSQEVERATRLKSEFLASMSHELRTPINALIGYTALLLDGVLGDVNPGQRDALTRARAAAEHLLVLINDILDLARIEAGRMPLHTEDVLLVDVAEDVARQVGPMARRKHLEFTIEVAPDCPTIHTDRAKIRQVLLNLVSNAVKFTNQGRVAVDARCTPAGVRIDVADTGIGIRQSDLQAIWDDFRQVDQSRTREVGGTGLGLSITRRLLDRLGGSVAVNSTYGEGSTFSVYLPLRVPSASEPEAVNR